MLAFQHATRAWNSAIPQLTVAAIHQGLDCMLRKWPYQAKVIKMFEMVRSTIVVMLVMLPCLHGLRECLVLNCMVTGGLFAALGMTIP